MKTWKIALIAIATTLTNQTNAALVERLGGLAYYDTEADLTWLADANAIVGTAYDTYMPGTGQVNWYDAMDWATNLDIDGVSGWRLPDSEPITLDNPEASCYWGFNCTGSEMGNLFYNVLGGIEGFDISATHNDNFYLFSNIQSNGSVYLSATEHDANTVYYYDLTGSQGWVVKDNPMIAYAWAVHDGDIASLSTVPIPAAFWMFITGLMGLFGIARTKSNV